MGQKSIQKRLIIFISVCVILLLVIGSLSIYFYVKRSYYRQAENQLEAESHVLLVEIVLQGKDIVHDWLADLEYHPESRVNDYIQVWDETTGETVRSQSLNGNDLEKFHGALYEYKYKSITLPNGKYARALGIKLYPTKNNVHKAYISAAEKPQILVLAHDASWILESLLRLKIYLFSIAAAIILVIFIIVSIIIKSSLKPLDKMAHTLSLMDGKSSNKEIKIPDDLPAELKEVILQYRDLLNRINNARARERRFTSNIAHELRTPLAGILTTLEASLIRPRSTEEYVDSMRKTKHIGEGMKQLVSKIMTLSHIENAEQNLELQVIPLKAFLRELFERSAKASDKQDVRANWEVEDHAEVYSDPEYLKVLFGNLFGNACSYSSDGQVNIASFSSDSKLTVKISNRAAKLDPETLSHLTEPFYRANSERSIDGHIGLGLTLCSQIAELLALDVTFSIPEPEIFEVAITFKKPISE